MSEDGPSQPTGPGSVDLTEKTLQASATAKLEQTRLAYEQAAEEQITGMGERLIARHEKVGERLTKSLTGGLHTTTNAINLELRGVEREAHRIGTLAKRLAWWPIIVGVIVGLLLAGLGLWMRVTLPTAFPPATAPTQTIIRGGSTYETINEKGWTICKHSQKPCKKLKDN